MKNAEIICLNCKQTFNLRDGHVCQDKQPLQSPVEERYDMIPQHALHMVALVFGDGTRKYGENNMHLVSLKDNLNHALRHINLAQLGDCMDEPSPRAHLTHAACRLLMAIEGMAVE